MISIQLQILTTYQTPQPQQTAQAQPANNVQPAGQPANAPQQPAQVRKHLTLTKEQMFEAQEMFRTANKVTRPEKALILGFMAGSRENPCPHLGKCNGRTLYFAKVTNTQCSRCKYLFRKH